MLQANRASDIFGQISRKIAILLKLAPEDRILLVGKLAGAWADDFKRYFNNCDSINGFLSVDASESSLGQKKYRLIVWDLSAEEAGKKLQNSFLRVIDIMDDQSSLILFAANRFSIQGNFKRPVDIIKNPFCSSKRYRILLERAGFEKVREFLPLPNLENMEEVVESEKGDIQLPNHFHIIIKLLNNIEVYRYFHDHYFYIASRSSSGIEQIISAIKAHLSEKLKSNGDLALERFDLRQRGALVLMLKNVTSGQRFVVRTASSSKVDQVIGKNALWIERIRSNRQISETVKSKIPHLFGKFPYRDNTIYVEELMEGILAWKLADVSRFKQKMFGETYSFLCDFNKSTQAYLEVDEGLFSKLVLDDVESAAVFSSRPEFKGILDEVILCLRKSLLGSRRFIVWGHGDFGYGNVLVNPKNAKLVGVIDWDTGRDLELAGVDLINLVIQKHRMYNNCSIIDALEDIGIKIIEKGFSIVDNSIDYDELFAIQKYQMREIFALFCLRLTFRFCRYPTLFEQNRYEITKYLGWINKEFKYDMSCPKG